jgi:zinc protease
MIPNRLLRRRVLLTAAALIVTTAAWAQAPAPAVRWPSEGPPRPLAARDVKFPPYHLQTLPNGLQVVAVLHHEQPVVSVRMIIRAGGALDPKDKLGLANLTAALLTQGTTTQSASELNDAIDFIGGLMGAGAGTDLSFINTIVMKDSFDTGLRMLSDMARRPAFAPEEIERQRKQILSTLQVSLENPEYVADAVFRRLVYGFHPYAWPLSGTPETIERLTRDDLVAFHRRYYVPNNAIMAVVGDVTVEEAFEEVRKVFGDWERREVPPPVVVAPPDPTRRVVVINKPDAVQTEIRVGHLGVQRNHSDFMPLDLAIRILGGEGANRLHQLLRTERGLTYGAQADMDTRRDSGDFEAATNTRSEMTGEVLRLMVDEFWRLQRERVGERELGDAKAYLSGSFPLTIETPDAIATQVLNVLFFGLPVEQLQSFRERVNAVTVDDIQRVSRFYLQPDRLSIALVGNAAAFVPQLRRLGFNTFETVEMEDLDLTSVDFRRPRFRASGPSQPGTGVEALGARPALAYQQTSTIVPREGDGARQLLDKMIAAKGGLATLRAVKSITATTRTQMRQASQEPGAPASPAESVTHLEYPNRVHVDTKLPNARIVQVFDGARAWIKDPAGVHEVPERAIRDLQLSLRRDTIAALLAAADGALRARLLPDVKAEDGRQHHALELSGADLEPMVIYADPDTHLIARQTYVAGGPGQAIVDELFADYRPVSGVQIAFTAQVRHDNQTVFERQVTDIKINAPLDPALFKRPEN